MTDIELAKLRNRGYCPPLTLISDNGHESYKQYVQANPQL